MKFEAGFGLEIDWVHQAFISAYEGNCPLKPLTTGRQSLRWTVEFESLRKGGDGSFNKCQSDKNPHSWALYREVQLNYRKEVRKASKIAWRTFCTSINDLPRSARLHRAFSRYLKISSELMVAPSGRRTQSKGETFLRALANYAFSQFRGYAGVSGPCGCLPGQKS